MLKKIILVVGLMASSSAFANYVNYCGEINKMYTWANGGDAYGVWVQLKENPSACTGGFYLSHEASNKQLVYSFLLSSKVAKLPICIQTHSTQKIANRCKINYVVDQ